MAHQILGSWFIVFQVGRKLLAKFETNISSGWDRTPLFISLLRISLWADGEIHQSLSAEEMLYLTVAYDWLLFSHQLSGMHESLPTNFWLHKNRPCHNGVIVLHVHDF